MSFMINSHFDKLLDKCTNKNRLELDWTAALQICDSIRQGDVSAHYALNAIKKRIFASNPYVCLFSLEVLESCVKNCGTPFHEALSSKDFQHDFLNFYRRTTNVKAKEKIRYLIQTWAMAFKDNPKYQLLTESYRKLRKEGVIFQPMEENQLMFMVDVAPPKIDSNECYRCRVQFGLMTRKHYCRNCGQAFCHPCSTNTSTIHHYGIEKEVRVCDSCFKELTTPKRSTQKANIAEQPSVSNVELLKQLEMQEEEELQLAMALSESEKTSNSRYSSSNESLHTTNKELEKYFDRAYWEAKAASEIQNIPSDQELEESIPSTSQGLSNIPYDEQDKSETADLDDFIKSFSSTLGVFVYRMTSDCSRGRQINDDNFVQSLFMTICDMHSKLLGHIHEADEKRNALEKQSEKLNQIREGRQALNSLREEHQIELQRQSEALQRQRQIQMSKKLELMRMKKREYIEQQRQMAMQKMLTQQYGSIPDQERPYQAIGTPPNTPSQDLPQHIQPPYFPYQPSQFPNQQILNHPPNPNYIPDNRMQSHQYNPSTGMYATPPPPEIQRTMSMPASGASNSEYQRPMPIQGPGTPNPEFQNPMPMQGSLAPNYQRPMAMQGPGTPNIEFQRPMQGPGTPNHEFQRPMSMQSAGSPPESQRPFSIQTQGNLPPQFQHPMPTSYLPQQNALSNSIMNQQHFPFLPKQNEPSPSRMEQHNQTFETQQKAQQSYNPDQQNPPFSRPTPVSSVQPEYPSPSRDMTPSRFPTSRETDRREDEKKPPSRSSSRTSSKNSDDDDDQMLITFD